MKQQALYFATTLALCAVAFVAGRRSSGPEESSERPVALPGSMPDEANGEAPLDTQSPQRTVAKAETDIAESISTAPTPERPKVPEIRRPQDRFVDAKTCLKDVELNPGGKALDKTRLEELEALLRRLDGELRPISTEVSEQTSDLLQQKLDRGDFQVVPIGVAPRQMPGAIASRMRTTRDGTRYVEAFPGDDYELDDALARRKEVLRDGYAQIAALIAAD